jgi:hypothetical protein
MTASPVRGQDQSAAHDDSDIQHPQEHDTPQPTTHNRARIQNPTQNQNHHAAHSHTTSSKIHWKADTPLAEALIVGFIAADATGAV